MNDKATEQVENEDTDVWVKTEMSLDGTHFAVVLEVGQDVARSFTTEETYRYARGVLSAVARAEYDAAVIGQYVNGLNMSIEATAQMVIDLRSDRPPIDHEGIYPLILEPGVSLSDLSPFIKVMMGDKVLGQWETADARKNVTHLLESIEVATLDACYFKTLTEGIGIDPGRAMNVIADLVNYRNERKEKLDEHP